MAPNQVRCIVQYQQIKDHTGGGVKLSRVVVIRGKEKRRKTHSSTRHRAETADSVCNSM